MLAGFTPTKRHQPGGRFKSFIYSTVANGATTRRLPAAARAADAWVLYSSNETGYDWVCRSGLGLGWEQSPGRRAACWPDVDDWHHNLMRLQKLAGVHVGVQRKLLGERAGKREAGLAAAIRAHSRLMQRLVLEPASSLRSLMCITKPRSTPPCAWRPLLQARRLPPPRLQPAAGT